MYYHWASRRNLPNTRCLCFICTSKARNILKRSVLFCSKRDWFLPCTLSKRSEAILNVNKPLQPVLFCTCYQAKFSLIFGLPFLIKIRNCSCLHQVHLFASCCSAFACLIMDGSKKFRMLSLLFPWLCCSLCYLFEENVLIGLIALTVSICSH